jgi:3-dehydroquinate synthase
MKADYKTVPVNLLDRSYPILIGKGVLSFHEMWLPRDIAQRKVYIVTDENVLSPHVERLQKALSDRVPQLMTYVLSPGEQAKSFSCYQQILEWLLKNGVNRHSLIIAAGGGVVGDLAGFVAASILRGIDFIQVPTTLLAQVDSSVGGKTGINSEQGKNLIGAFYQPKNVVIDLDTLATLPHREILAGYAEIVKYGLLGNIRFFEWLEQNGHKVCAGDTDALSYAIETSCKMKAEIVQQDEREENGLRALLNLGHTFAHALETACEYDGRLLHGEAVGIGLVLAGRLSEKLGLISPSESERIKSHLQSLGMKTEISDITPPVTVSADDLLALMQKDKKMTPDGLAFVVLQKLGRAKLDKAVTASQVRALLQDSMHE